ncbi:hypothetical protein LB507_010872 [Fusarium sp. FIESC RH6]|nr:hypothetical protein LB507_010872 [Fusarium sp. FIESC RH6]
MKFLAALAPFISTAAAVDGYLHTSPDCTVRSGPGGFGSYLRCTNMRARTCCGIDTTDSPYQSLAMRGIMDGFSLWATGYIGGNCTTIQAFGGSNWNSQFCIYYSRFNFTGLDHSNGVRKRAGDKKGCQRPDTLVLSDGTEYNLGGLNNHDFKNIIDISAKTTQITENSERFEKLIVK